MGLLAGLTIDGLFKILKGIGIFKDPEAEAKAKAALNDVLSKFYQSTSGKLYEAARFLLFLGATWDIFANQSRAWAAAATNMNAQGLIGYVELFPLLWLYMGPETWSMIKEVFASRRANAEAERVKYESRLAEANEHRERERKDP